jgi:hypothetical protein
MSQVPSTYKPSILNYNNALKTGRTDLINSTANAIKNQNGTQGITTGGLPNPSTSGQTPTGGGGVPPAPQTDPYLQQLRDAFSGVRSSLESQLPTYDSDFSNYQNQANQYIDQAKQTADQSKTDAEFNFGDTLKNALKTDKEIRQRQQGTFSALGTLDSSAYTDAVAKEDQNLGDNVNSIGKEKSKALTGIDQQFAAYQTDAMGKIQAYKNEIDRAKDGVRQAMANADLQSASSIANYMQQLQQQQASIQNNLANFKLNLAGMQAQGVDVMGNLQKLNGTDFNNTFGGLLSSQLGSANSQFSVPQAGVQGQGYISPKTGRKYNSYQDMVQAEGQ